MPAPKPILRRRIGKKSLYKRESVIQHDEGTPQAPTYVGAQHVMNKPKVVHVKKGIYITGVIVFLLLLCGVGYYFFVYQKPSFLPQKTTAEKGTVSDVVKEVEKLIDLPQDEPPTLATVSDVTKLQGQAFFAKAQNGDKVLIYTNAKKAFLYRPSTKKLIEVGPVSIPTPTETSVQGVATNSGSLTPSPSGAQSDEVKIALYNGSGITGVTRTAEAKLTTGVENTEVVTRENAQGRDYQETLIVNVSGQKKAAHSQIISALGVGKVGALPAGETRPTGVDVLIILGTDFTGE